MEAPKNHLDCDDFLAKRCFPNHAPSKIRSPPKSTPEFGASHATDRAEVLGAQRLGQPEYRVGDLTSSLFGAAQLRPYAAPTPATPPHQRRD